jgi:hypothetical protein
VDERQKTVMFPYCGGCGRENLVLGVNDTESCEHCGRLVCPNPACRFRRAACREHQIARCAAARNELPAPQPSHALAVPDGLAGGWPDDDHGLPF